MQFQSLAESEEERAAMLKALRQSESLFSRYYLNEEFNEVLFNFELRDDIIIGQPFRYSLDNKFKHFTQFKIIIKFFVFSDY